MKLTKKQNEFFSEFAFNILAGSAVSLTGADATPEQIEALVLKASQVDLSALRDKAAEEFLSRVDFKTLAKVDKLLKSDEVLSVVNASAEVNKALEAELVEALTSLLADALA